ncbi:LCCL domain-containing protein [Pelagovum pacificum]|nr:LCCL domain-containing protein [Pelagovum pacificum]QQA43284.1 hypothetical protein I8N54_01555 [Pelagovum pacificum]
MKRIPTVAVAGLLSVTASLSAAQEACPSQLPTELGTFSCSCGAGVFLRSNLWGTGTYTGDSDVCAAAVHAGVITRESGGTVTIELIEGLESHTGSSANGVNSRDWGSYRTSYSFVTGPEACGAYPVGEASYECGCSADDSTGSIWGSDPYTADSSICTAARHAGVIGEDGGTVVAIAEPGQETYSASSANGVTTSDWGSYDSSFTFRTASAIPAGFEMCGAFPETQVEYACGCGPDAASGSVWGSGPYTSDSDICAAALHAGVIGTDGGPVTVLAYPGLAAYLATDANGVETMDWGENEMSIIFDRNRSYP